MRALILYAPQQDFPSPGWLLTFVKDLTEQKGLVLSKELQLNFEIIMRMLKRVQEEEDLFLKSEQLSNYNLTMGLLLDAMHKQLGWKAEAEIHDFYQKVLGTKGLLFWHWIGEAIEQDIEPFAMHVGYCKKLENSDPKKLISILEQFDIHILTNVQYKYSPTKILPALAQKKKFFIGYERFFDKINFSVLPFVVANSDELLKGQLPSEPHFQALVKFGRENGRSIKAMIPPFVTFPTVAAANGVPAKAIKAFYDFFKGKCGKVIVKGNASAASNSEGGECPYVIIDTGFDNEEDALETWFEAINEYVFKYVKVTQESGIMIQAMVDSSSSPHHNETKQWGDLLNFSAHKQNVVGNEIWNMGTMYMMQYAPDIWQQKKITINQVAKGCDVYCRDISSTHNEAMIIAGAFINLVTPFGAHSLDVCIGKLTNDLTNKFYMLEANPSAVRGDTTGTDYWSRGGKDDTEGHVAHKYLNWAVSHLKNKEDASGETTKLYLQIDEQARADFVRSVNKLWEFAEVLLCKFVLFCDKDLHFSSPKDLF